MKSRQKAARPQRNAYAIAVNRVSHIVNTRRYRQDGAFAVMFIPLLIVMIGFWGLAVDMGQIYNRKVDLYGVAKAAAVAAARELDGTPAGLIAAKTAASIAVANLRYHNYGEGTPFTWRDTALSFGTTSSRTGNWVSAETIGTSTQAAELLFARVDTAGLDPAIGTIRTAFINIFSSELTWMQLSDSAIAGRTSIKVTPIGICAMSPNAATERSATSTSGATLSELVQYGFRRGISYDLMKLNPNNTTPARFVINPVAEPGTSGQSFSFSALAPFVCSGSMWVRGIADSTVRVTELPAASPLASLSAALNTRFDAYANTPCNPSGTVPDINIKEYAYDQAGVIKWMSPGSGAPAVATTTERGKKEPIIDLPAPPASTGDYGPLWAYSKAVKAPSPLNSPEPAGGYATFSPADWPTLYPNGPTSSSYPTSPPLPYLASTTASGNYLSPRVATRPLAIPNRRVLNIPLLACNPAAPSGTNAQATVVAIGRFFMTVQATDDSLIAEFAGVLPSQSPQGHVELFP